MILGYIAATNMKCKTCMWFVPKMQSKDRRAELTGNQDPHVFYDIGRCRRHCPNYGRISSCLCQ